MCTDKKSLRNKLFQIILLILVPVLAAKSQQGVIANKMNTRTDVTKPFGKAVGINYFTATRLNGVNEIHWAAHWAQDTRRFIVEYSTDGINFLSAGEVPGSTTSYQLKHHIFETRPMLYRLKMERFDGRHVYSQTVFLDGQDKMAVTIYPTMVTGNTVNAVASFPVERIVVTNLNGQQLYVQEVGGRSESMNISIPSLGKGMYWMTFTGQGWNSTSKFIIP